MSLRNCARLTFLVSHFAKHGCRQQFSSNMCSVSACHSSLRPTQGIMASCDTFVALPSVTKGGCVVFGKNSDRPKWEVQEVVYCPPADYQPNATVSCTYISIPQASHTAAVVLSKPAWMWGAEMGSNEHGVCIGNEAVYTKLLGENGDQEQLLGMDLVRLGLERGRTAREALNVITELLEAHGQGGPCCDDADFSFYTYHNSFIIADHREAWVLETADREWAAEVVTDGVRNISNLLTIHTKIDAMSKGLKQAAEERGFWKPSDGEFDFAKVFSAQLPDTVEASKQSPEGRYNCGRELLAHAAKAGNVDASAMFNILREKTLCMMGEPLEESIPLPLATMGSQVSVIRPPVTNKPSVHWFTATPNPRQSVFKPFVFVPSVTSAALTLTTAPSFGDADPAKKEPRFETTVDRRHALFRAHEAIEPLCENENGGDVVNKLRQLESGCVTDVDAVLDNFNPGSLSEITKLFKNMVESEIKFYGKTSHKL